MTPTILYRETGRFNSADNSAILEPVQVGGFGRPMSAPQAKYLFGAYENFVGQMSAQGLPTQGKEFWDRFNAATGTADNNAGFQRVIDTLTGIRKQVVGQKLYTVPFADYIPVEVGNNAWTQKILTPLSFMVSGDPEEGYNSSGNTGGNATTSDAEMGSLTTNVKTWFDSVTYGLADVNQALLSSNWDIIAAKHATRKAKADQLLQRVAFMGSYVDSANVTGLLTATNVNILASLPGGFTGYINTMTAAQITTFVAALAADYFANSNSTELPDTFVIPMADWLGLVAPFPGAANPVPMIDYLLLAFKKVFGEKFQIKPVAYASAADAVNVQFTGGTHIYALYRKDSQSLRMEIPVPFQVQAPGTADGIKFVDTAVMQHTGLIVSRPLELRIYKF